MRLRKPARINPHINVPERHRPHENDRVVIKGKNCRLTTDDRMGFGFRTEEGPQEEFQLTVEQYVRGRRDGSIDLKRGYHDEGQARIRAALRGKTVEEIAQKNKPKITKAKYRETLIQMYLKEEAL